MAGSGKSTLSRSLLRRPACRSFISIVHFWKPGWLRRRSLEWREKQAACSPATWIADGNYHESLDLHERADTVVFLTPWWVRETRSSAACGNRLGDVRRVRRSVLATVARRVALAIVIWRNRRSEPDREQEIISQYGSTRSFTRSGPNGQHEFLDG